MTEAPELPFRTWLFAPGNEPRKVGKVFVDYPIARKAERIVAMAEGLAARDAARTTAGRA
ncbi:MAG TPA: hypothetical protein VML54_17280 [Candidatus Limnocylindrales bacterium]|nr:hypothetical protein [Candidatus Limnocylindrales bacterium]